MKTKRKLDNKGIEYKKMICRGHVRSTRRNGTCAKCGGDGLIWRRV